MWSVSASAIPVPLSSSAPSSCLEESASAILVASSAVRSAGGGSSTGWCHTSPEADVPAERNEIDAIPMMIGFTYLLFFQVQRIHRNGLLCPHGKHCHVVLLKIGPAIVLHKKLQTINSVLHGVKLYRAFLISSY